ncbi:hypothetical protein DSO57_1003963 [Entomophthora muscae]|uniref:Uncharacterized protein n=1 Tax=Entomophthora muscae TaxID=34485 RepID=A0ACC2TWV7_9FUNG|nr:hypothetical protein DSO57_1003963 [Entomophthora muscae]
MKLLIFTALVEITVQTTLETTLETSAEVRLVNSERERVGIAPLHHTDALDKMLQKVYLFKRFPSQHPLSLEKQKAEAVFKDSCELFKDGCGDKTAADLIAALGVRIIEPDSEAAIESRVLFEKNKDAFLSRGAYACQPWAAVAETVVDNKPYLALLPPHTLNQSPQSDTSFRPVDFCPDKLVEGMSAYWVPDAFSDFRSLYNEINLARTAKELPPFMFSAPLSSASTLDTESLKCQITPDIACMPLKIDRSKFYKTWSHSFSNDSISDTLLAFNEQLITAPHLLSADGHQHWYAIGFSKSENNINIRIAASQPSTPQLRKTMKLCRRRVRSPLQKN